jgi:transposase
MSTSFLYHAYNLKGVKYNSTDFYGNAIVFHAETTRTLARCPECRSRDVIYKGQKVRELLLCRCAQKKMVLKLKIHRILCRSCQKIRWPELPFAPNTQRYVNSFAIFEIELLKFATITSVADFLGVSWDTIKSIHKKKLSVTYKSVDLQDIQYMMGSQKLNRMASLQSPYTRHRAFPGAKACM